MAIIKKTQIRPEDGNDYETILYPETSTDMVIDEATGESVATLLAKAGTPGGGATLDTDGKVPVGQLREDWNRGTYTTTRRLPKREGNMNHIYTYSIQTFTINVGTDVQEVLFTIIIEDYTVGYVRVFRSEQNWAVGQSGGYQNFFTRIARTNNGYGSTWTGSESYETIPYIARHLDSSTEYLLVDAYLSGSNLILKVTNASNYDYPNMPVKIDYMTRR